MAGATRRLIEGVPDDIKGSWFLWYPWMVEMYRNLSTAGSDNFSHVTVASRCPAKVTQSVSHKISVISQFRCASSLSNSTRSGKFHSAFSIRCHLLFGVVLLSIVIVTQYRVKHRDRTDVHVRLGSVPVT